MTLYGDSYSTSAALQQSLMKNPSINHAAESMKQTQSGADFWRQLYYCDSRSRPWNILSDSKLLFRANNS